MGRIIKRVAIIGLSLVVLFVILVYVLADLAAGRAGSAYSARHRSVQYKMNEISEVYTLYMEKDGSTFQTEQLSNDSIAEAKGEEYDFLSENQIINYNQFDDHFTFGTNRNLAWYQAGNSGLLISIGGDRVYEDHPSSWFNDGMTSASVELLSHTYDPTNGTFSPGDIYRIVNLEGRD